MGFCIILEGEDREPLEQVEDPKDVLHQLLPSEDASYHYLRFIDWYGDTVFNRLQIQPFIREWDRLTESAQTSDQTAILRRIKELALRCRQEPHLYLRFYGD
jgi:hypothetical protein